MEDIFTPDNTRWETEDGRKYLVYDGDMEELAEETGKTEDELYELLGEYEDESNNLIEYQRETNEARKGQY